MIAINQNTLDQISLENNYYFTCSFYTLPVQLTIVFTLNGYIQFHKRKKTIYFQFALLTITRFFGETKAAHFVNASSCSSFEMMLKLSIDDINVKKSKTLIKIIRKF